MLGDTRKYSVKEIDGMRRAIEGLLWLENKGVSIPPADRVEDRLRTYMLNGSGPEELEQAYKAKWEEMNKPRDSISTTGYDAGDR